MLRSASKVLAEVGLGLFPLVDGRFRDVSRSSQRPKVLRCYCSAVFRQ